MPQSLRYISFDSYIKPQLVQKSRKKLLSCISFDSYIKPQPIMRCSDNSLVVYLLIPTSNHNCRARLGEWAELYIF